MTEYVTRARNSATVVTLVFSRAPAPRNAAGNLYAGGGAKKRAAASQKRCRKFHEVVWRIGADPVGARGPDINKNLEVEVFCSSDPRIISLK